MRVIKYIFYRLKDLFWAIAPFKIYSESVDLGAVDREYRPELDALAIEQAQLAQLRQLLTQIVQSVHQIVINSISLKMLLEKPNIAIQFNNNPENEKIKNQVDELLHKDGYNSGYEQAQSLGSAILKLIYEEYPILKKASDKLNNRQDNKAEAGQDE